MSYLLDTVMVSAIRVPRRNPGPNAWLNAHQNDPLWISALTIGEIAQGVEMQAEAAARRTLAAWLDGIVQSFGPTILPFGTTEALVWGRLVAPLQLAGNPMGVVDSQIAATALANNLRVVTRNVRHFEPFGVEVINPWDDESGA